MQKWNKARQVVRRWRGRHWGMVRQSKLDQILKQWLAHSRYSLLICWNGKWKKRAEHYFQAPLSGSPHYSTVLSRTDAQDIFLERMDGCMDEWMNEWMNGTILTVSSARWKGIQDWKKFPLSYFVINFIHSQSTAEHSGSKQKELIY